MIRRSWNGWRRWGDAVKVAAEQLISARVAHGITLVLIIVIFDNFMKLSYLISLSFSSYSHQFNINDICCIKRMSFASNHGVFNRNIIEDDMHGLIFD